MVVATRPLRGSRLSSFYPPVPVDGPSMSDLDSAFQLQEYISLLIRQNPYDVDAIVTNPGRVKASGKGEDRSELSPDKETRSDIVVDEACWIYEQLRRLAQDLTHPLITALQQECSRASCPEMKAGEWLYLCVAHGNDGAMEQCCAIDYIIHTLDSATALLNSPRAFPSRISIPQPSIRHFSSLARRLGRIFAHAYFHHREAFESAEAENALYARFLALTARFNLVPPEFLVIPPRMTNPDTSTASGADAEPPRLLGAALHPQPASPEKPSPTVLESPRKLGRNRTDTMVFSDAEAYTEALRGHTDSPPALASSSGPSDQEKDASTRADSLGLDTSEGGREGGGGAGGIPHVESLELFAESPETCRPAPAESEQEGETRPYTLTFSASGTMKTALPPGVSPSSSSQSSIALTPSAANFNNTSQLEARDFTDAIEERAPASEAEEESALNTVLSQEEEEDASVEHSGDTRLIDLLARKQVLDRRVQDLDPDEGNTEWSSGIQPRINVSGLDFSQIDFSQSAAAEVEVDEVPSEMEKNVGAGEGEGESGEFVVVGEQDEESAEKTEFEPEHRENQSASVHATQSVHEETTSVTVDGSADVTTETASGKADEIFEHNEAVTAAAEGASENSISVATAVDKDDKGTSAASEDKEPAGEGDNVDTTVVAAPDTSEEQPSKPSPTEEGKTEKVDSGEESEHAEVDPDVSLETDVAEVENVLGE